MVSLSKIKDTVIKGEVDEVRDLVKKAIGEGWRVEEVLNEGLVSAMSVVGEKYEKGEFFLPEMVIAAKAMREGLKVLRPLLLQSKVKTAGTVILGTVKGDIHDIGKTIVGTMLEGAGFMVIDIGADVDPNKLVEAA